MSPRTLPDDVSLSELRAEIGYTHRRLLAYALTRSLAPRFETLLSDWTAVHQKVLEVDDKVDSAIVVAHVVDHELNRFAQRVSTALLDLTNNDRTHPLYLHFFRGDPVHVFVRPILANQLKATRTWMTSLSESEHPSLQALGAELPALIDRADAAELARTTAKHEQRTFRDLGERKKLVDAVNAARKETHGVLATLRHTHTRLPPQFAESFFRRGRVRIREEEPTIEAMRAAVEALQVELEERQQALARLEQEQAAAKLAEEKAARLATEAKLAEIQQEIARKQKEAAALQATLT